MEFLKNLIVNIGLWLQGLLASTSLPETWERAITRAAGALALALVPLVAIFFFIWYERKIVARIGSRLGPNNSGAYGGPWGIFQVFADAIKMFTKEDVIPAGADRWVFNVAPMLTLAIAVMIWAVLPLGKGLIGIDLNIGIFYLLSLGSGSIVAVVMAGWGSNNKYALLAAFRSIATLISYEIPKALSVLAVVMLAGSLSMQDIVAAQDVAFLLALPLTAFLFLAATLSELGRRPFDLVEADSEIVAGYFVEYSGIKFGMFYVAQFMNQSAAAAIFSTLFLGGWRGPWVDQVPVLSTLWLTAKILLSVLIIQFFQYTLPRLRIDQVLAFNWKFLTPLALVNVCAVALAGKTVPASAGPLAQAGISLGANVVLALIVLGILAIAGRQARQREASRLATQ